jgi:hypothetical protein
MEFSEKDMQLIEEYLDGKLSKKEVDTFRQRLKNDKDFAKAFELRKKMPALMKEALEFQSTRDEVRAAIQQEKMLLFGFNRNWFYAAATIVILIGLFVVIKFANTNDTGPGTQMADDKQNEVLKIDKPTNYAKMNDFDSKVEIVSPTEFQTFRQGNEIVLKWQTESLETAKIVVSKFGQQEVLFFSEIVLSDHEFVLPAKNFEPGKYTWYINDTVLSGSFKVEPNK